MSRPDTQKANILIVDDAPENLAVLSRMLEDNGYRVRSAISGAMALKTVQKALPDLILLDIRMPGMDGYAVCQQLKADESTRGVPVIFISALDDVADKVHAFAVGGVDYITKPFHAEEVMARVATHLALHAMQRRLEDQKEQLENEIAERQCVEEALRENQAWLNAIFNTAMDAIISVDKQQHIVLFNPAAEHVFGCSAAEAIGQPLNRFIPPEYHIAHAAHIHQFGAANVTSRHMATTKDVLGLRTNGEVFPVETSISQFVIDGQQFYTAILRDVTKRKQVEDALQRAYDEMEQRVAERTSELTLLNEAYRSFVPAEFLSILNKDNIIEAELGDQIQREMTIMFTDIRSFTTLSEQMTPQENFTFLNNYLSRVSPVIRQNSGFIDKYIGDAIMALFPQRAEDALQAAIAMLGEVNCYNIERQAIGKALIRIGIGLHIGHLMVGIIGEEHRKQVTVIADAVNLAARLEGLTRLYGASIVVSEQVLFSLDRPNRYHFRFLDKVKVKGKQEPVSVFEILDGNPEEIMQMRLEMRTDFEKGLLHYHNQEFHKALAHFERILEVDQQDSAAQLYLKRITHYLQHGVPLTWDGIETLNEK